MSLFDDDALAPDVADVDAPNVSLDEGLLPPRESMLSLGHDDIEAHLIKLFNADRLPAAMIFTGPRGIGKATFAYRLTRFLLSGRDDTGMFDTVDTPAETMDVNIESPSVRRVNSGGHGDVHYVGLTINEKTKKMRKSISAEEARGVVPFLRRTSSEGGWRIVIVDQAESLNSESQNALLKILEEPPEKTVLIVITDQMGGILPTTKSRCQIFHFKPLNDAHMRRLLKAHDSSLGDDVIEPLIALAKGRIGRALELVETGGMEAYAEVVDVLAKLPKIDKVEAFDIAEKLGKTDAGFGLYMRLLRDVLGEMALAQAKGHAPPVVQSRDAEVFQKIAQIYTEKEWFDAWDRVKNILEETERMHLDRKQAVMNVIWALEKKD